jgi:hypothetical protein
MSKQAFDIANNITGDVERVPRLAYSTGAAGRTSSA